MAYCSSKQCGHTDVVFLSLFFINTGWNVCLVVNLDDIYWFICQKSERLWDYSKARWRLHNTSVLRNVVALRFRMFQLSMSFVSDCQMCQLTLHKELDWQVIWPIITPNLLSCLTNTFRQENRLTWVDLTWKMLCVLMSFSGWNKMPSDVHSCLFHALNKYEKMIGLHGAWTKVLAQWVQSFRMHFFVFVILSYQNACYRWENAENWTWLEFCLWRTKVSEAVCKHDWHNVRSYIFFTWKHFWWEFLTQCAKTLTKKGQLAVIALQNNMFYFKTNNLFDLQRVKK